MGLRILIADDNVNLRNMLKALINTRPNWKVCGEASNGCEAVSRAAETDPDVIILDLSMPDMDGLQAANLISSTLPHVPILLYTNHVLPPSARREVRKYGITDVVMKGASPQKLLSTVESLQQVRIGGGRR